ncbi:hypothetical protein FGG08_000598 [Glutinoglossum americanum]|uniref:Uncharacterized protein n=1 Tax=Glutinoglossum americanum TaxID=1670608 RepID=A0A9P8I8L0_9PEZI|nr:hypothetical protein FGG08_000598 [Glutinoglossum americanum]
MQAEGLGVTALIDSPHAEQTLSAATRPQQDEEEPSYLNTRRLNGIVSAPDTPLPSTHRRRQSLPLNILGLWSLSSRDTSTVSLADPGQCGTGEPASNDSTATHLRSALRQLNGGPRPRRHRHSKSTIVRNSTFSQPVIVRTYSGSRPGSRQQVPATLQEEEMDKTDLPTIEEFSFDGILRAIEPEVSNTLDAIANLCANYRSNLSQECDYLVLAQGELDKKMEETDKLTTSVLEETNARSERIATDSKPLEGGNIASDIAYTASTAYSTLQNILATLTDIEELLPLDERIGHKEHYPRTHSLLVNRNGENRAVTDPSTESHNGIPKTPKQDVAKHGSWKREHPSRSKSAGFYFAGGSLNGTRGKQSEATGSPSGLLLRTIEPCPSTSSSLESAACFPPVVFSGSPSPGLLSRPMAMGFDGSTDFDSPLAPPSASFVQTDFPRVEGGVVSEYSLKSSLTGSMPHSRPNPSRRAAGHSRRTSIFGRWQDWLSRDGPGNQNPSSAEAGGAPAANKELNAEGRLRIILRGAGSERVIKGKSVDRGS